VVFPFFPRDSIGPATVPASVSSRSARGVSVVDVIDRVWLARTTDVTAADQHLVADVLEVDS
jgi:hypothetical protein